MCEDLQAPTKDYIIKFVRKIFAYLFQQQLFHDSVLNIFSGKFDITNRKIVDIVFQI